MTHAIHEAIEGTNTTWTDDYRFRHADGTWAEILDRGILVRDTRGTARRMIGSMMVSASVSARSESSGNGRTSFCA